MDFRVVGGGISSIRRLVKRVFIGRSKIVSFTILVVIVGLEGDGEVYSYK